MSSSQGPNNIVNPRPLTTPYTYPLPDGTPAGYVFNKAVIRDGSDWTAYKRQARVYENYVSSNTTDNQVTEDWWLKYGNGFRVQYLFGRFKCKPCISTAFYGKVGN